MDAGTHLLYVLLDSNLPTGGFVASSGLESWAKHGFLSFDPDPSPVDGARAAGGSSGSTKTSGDRTGNGGIHENGVPAYGRRPVNPTGAAAGVTDFARAEIENYHSTTGGFVKGAWDAVSLHLAGISTCAPQQTNDSRTPRTATVQDTMQKLLCLDKYHEASMLSHVSRRASKAQGVAMLTLYTKGLSTPTIHGDPTCGTGATVEGTGIGQARELVDAYKWLIRKNVAPGHLAVCWGIMTAALGIPLGTSDIFIPYARHAEDLPRANVAVRTVEAEIVVSGKLIVPNKPSTCTSFCTRAPSCPPRSDSTSSVHICRLSSFCTLSRPSSTERLWPLWTMCTSRLLQLLPTQTPVRCPRATRIGWLRSSKQAVGLMWKRVKADGSWSAKLQRDKNKILGHGRERPRVDPRRHGRWASC